MTMSVWKASFSTWEKNWSIVTLYFLPKSRSMNIFYVVNLVTIKDKEGKKHQKIFCRIKELFIDQNNYFFHKKSFLLVAEIAIWCFLRYFGFSERNFATFLWKLHGILWKLPYSKEFQKSTWRKSNVRCFHFRVALFQCFQQKQHRKK